MAASRESLLFWVNAFVWTCRFKVTDPDTGKDRQAIKDHMRGINEVDVPFITWPCQDRAFEQIDTLIEQGGDGLIDKSRDMGATWVLVASFEHAWLFGEHVSILWVSATSADVDLHPQLNPDTVFYKHDYLFHWLPSWMKPPVNRVRMHRGNQLNGNSMDGEATTANIGRGGRRTVIGFDEFAAVEDGFGMLESSADTTATRIFNSTPKGPGTAFTHIRNKARAGEQATSVKLVQLPWWEHPEKGRGRRLITDPVTGEKKYTSPWYEVECKRRTSKKEIAQNLDMDHLSSGDRFFDGAILARHRSTYARKPLYTCSIDFDKRYNPDQVEQFIAERKTRRVRCARNAKRRPWSLWIDLVNARPDQTYHYVIGVDVSNGQGASNSVISVRCVETGEKVAEFADADTPPHDLARIVCAAGLFFGGQKNWPLVVWESNGPGGIFGKELIRMGYPNFYFEGNWDSIRAGKSQRYGWHSNRQKKEDLLGIYRRALARDDVINHSDRAIDEAEEYIYYDGGGIGPAQLLQESEQARSTHGDRVIADALTVIGMMESPEAEAKEPAEPLDSIAGRRRKYRARRQTSMRRWERRAQGRRRNAP